MQLQDAEWSGQTTEEYVEQKQKGMDNIEKLLKERGQIHGDAEVTHGVARKICKILMEHSKLSEAGEEMARMIVLKMVRGVQVPSHADHWDDIGGYSRLIRKVECE